jgi:hypothetical protein
MTNLLQKTLHDEAVKRDTEAAKKAAYKEEANRITAGIHAAFAPYEVDLANIQLTGDYGRPMPVRGKYGYTKDHGTPIRHARSLIIDLGSDISKEYLRLDIYERTDTDPPTIKLWIERRYPYKPQDLQGFDGFTPPEEMLEAFFKALAPRIYIEKTK